MDLDGLEQRLRAFQESRILLTGIELDVFSHVATGATAGAVASRAGLRPEATARLLNALVALDLLRKVGDKYENTPLAARFLDQSSPECARPAWLHLVHRWHTWSELTAHLRGDAAAEQHRELDRPRHEALLAMLHRRSGRRAPAVVAAVGVEGVRRILDLGGGSGAYSVAFARADPELRADVFDLPEVMPITRSYLAQAGVADRVRAVAGDFLSGELGSGYDLVLLCSVTHLLGPDEIRVLLPRCYRALRPGGRIAIVDHVLNEAGTSPRESVVFALNMLMVTAHGGTYSFDEYQAWLSGAGFGPVTRPWAAGSAGLLLASRPERSAGAAD